MKAYSADLRSKIVKAHLNENRSIRQVAASFSVSKSLVQKLVKQQRNEGNVERKRPGKPQLSYLNNAEAQEQLKGLVAEYQDATLAELCELFAQLTGNWVSTTAMCRWLQKLRLSRKKKRGRVARLRPIEYNKKG